MSRYKISVDVGGETIYINGAFLGLEPDGLDRYANFLIGKSHRNVNFEKGPVKGVSFELSDPEGKRINIVMFNAVPVYKTAPLDGVYKCLPVSAHALSDSVSEEMLEEFSRITGFGETDVGDRVVELYIGFEKERVGLSRNNPRVIV